MAAHWSRPRPLEFDYNATFDTDMTPLPLQDTPYGEDFRSISQEVRYISPPAARSEYVIGAAYTRTWTEVNNQNIYLNQPSGPGYLTGSLQTTSMWTTKRIPSSRS